MSCTPNLISHHLPSSDSQRCESFALCHSARSAAELCQFWLATLAPRLACVCRVPVHSDRASSRLSACRGEMCLTHKHRILCLGQRQQPIDTIGNTSSSCNDLQMSPSRDEAPILRKDFPRRSSQSIEIHITAGCRNLFSFLHPLINLTPMHWHVSWCIDPDPHNISTNLDDL